MSCFSTINSSAVPVAAGVVGDRGVIAVAAAHDMAAERSRAAGPDRTDHLELAAAEPMTHEESLAMPAEDGAASKTFHR